MEKWKDIKDYEGLYQISDKGRIKSLERRCKAKHYTRRVPERICANAIDTYGYPIIALHKDGKKKTRTVHRLVAEAFIDNPLNYNNINHIDENKLNNNTENLEWCTNKYNAMHGTRPTRIREKQQKAIIQCDLDGREIQTWDGMGIMSRQTGYDQGLISRVCNGKRNTAYGYLWKFK